MRGEISDRTAGLESRTRFGRVAEWMVARPARAYLVFLLAAVLPLGLFFYSAGKMLREQLEERSRRVGTQTALLSAQLVEERFRQSTVFLEAFASRPLLRQALAARDARVMTYHLKIAYDLQPEFAFISVYDLDGTMRGIYPPDAGVVGRNFAHRDWYRGVSREWKPYVSEVYQTAVAPRPLVVAVAVPLKEPDGTRSGILMAPYRLKTIADWMGHIQQEGAWRISVVDQNGRLLAGPGVEASEAPIDLRHYPPVAELQAGQAGTGIFPRGAEEFFVAYTPIVSLGWGLVAERPLSLVLQSAQAVERQLGLLALVFTGLALGGGALVGSLQARLGRARDEVQAAAQELDRFFTLSLDMLCIAGFDGRFKRLNPAWSRALGFSEEELQTQPYLGFVHPDDRERTAAEAERLTQGLHTVSFENRYRCRDGSYRWLLWTAAPLVGKELIYAAARDVTAQKEAEQRIQRINAELAARTAELSVTNQELGAANQELEAFTYSVSHDLRAPLRHIDGFSRLLLEEHSPKLPEEARHYLERVREGTRQMGNLVDDLLNLSRVGRQELRRQATGLASLVEEARRELTGELEGREVEWRISPLPFADCDPTLMKQVFTNLLSNAVKFTRPRKPAVIEVGGHTANGAPAIFVRDNGVGFSMKYADKLFGVFQRLHRPEDFEGTGVGLATVQRIIQKHGGRVWAEAELDKGATFYFTLQASPSGQALQAAPSAQALQGGPSGQALPAAPTASRGGEP